MQHSDSEETGEHSPGNGGGTPSLSPPEQEGEAVSRGRPSGKKILLGVGNTLRRDDGAGSFVARNFRQEGWMAIDCGTVPENVTGIVRRERPGLVVIVDAADMGIFPGEFRVIPKEKVRDVSFGTHQLPLDIVIDYLLGLAERVVLVGIQPLVVETGEGLSPPVREGARRLIGMLGRGEIGRIAVYG